MRNLFKQLAEVKRPKLVRNEIGGYDTDSYTTVYGETLKSNPKALRVRLAPDTDQEEFRIRGQVNYSTHKMAAFRADYVTEMLPEDIVIIEGNDYRLLSVIEPSQKGFQIQFKLQIDDKGSEQ